MFGDTAYVKIDQVQARNTSLNFIYEIESNAVLDWFAYYSCIQKINLIDSIIKCDVSLRQVLDRCIVAYKYINVRIRLVHTVELRYTSSSLAKGDYPWRFSIHWINKHRRLSPLESKDGTLRQSPKKLILNAGMWVKLHLKYIHFLNWNYINLNNSSNVSCVIRPLHI